ncbi:hypothetical protein SLEP1_g33548 [Rubroshorea leprosula]|uniref:BZIP domain-containing protein n=1 Tax=Rubroshorea leprosula TaxID=152421 RepID=A0AAV5KH62_9ROSI|nr:hypothetical protein SLEP1_g33548 [Rubroshorea leprosula]
MAMASSKVITNNSQTNSDLPRQPSLYPSLSTLLSDLQNQQPQQLQQNQSMNMDDLLNNIYSSPPTPPTNTEANAQFSGASISREDLESKSFDDVWKGIVAGCGDQRQGGAPEKVTLEEFLIGKTGAVGDGEVGVVVNQVGGGSVGAVGTGVYAPVEPAAINGGQFSGFPSNSGADRSRLVGPSGGGRGKRRAVEEPPVDKATQQKQKRMIKNRESAARSRERKHAHTVVLETRLSQLEEENARLLREEAEYNKERLKQLMKNLIPVEQKPRRPHALLERVNSV